RIIPTAFRSHSAYGNLIEKKNDIYANFSKQSFV
ncbi:hypothetical protein MHK_005723, partial [Candidatus Magnetomorum sp. HK-1]